ncbi:hypothetical protein ACKWTF_003984 [Chironomus riparius]
MPRFYPERDCDFYVERLVDNYHDANPSVLRKNQLKNRIRWFHEPTQQDLNKSVIYSWGSGDKFKSNTNFKSDYFIKSRLRRRCKLPIAGRRGMWKMTRFGTAGMCVLPLDKWNFQEWLEESSFKGIKVEDN